MPAWLITAIERLPPGSRRLAVAASALLLLSLAGTITSLTLEWSDGGVRRRTPIPSPPSRPAPARPLPPPVSPPVSATGLHTARVVAARFLLSYLLLAYGRGSAGSVKAVTPQLRSQLTNQRAPTTPAERRRHPRVVSLTTLGTTPGFVVATAIIEDGGIAAFQLRLTLQEQAGRWLVNSAQEP
jgi:hypothetical protein